MCKDVRLGNGTKEQAGKIKHSGTWQTSPDTLMDVCLSLSHPYTHTHTHTHTHTQELLSRVVGSSWLMEVQSGLGALSKERRPPHEPRQQTALHARLALTHHKALELQAECLPLVTQAAPSGLP